MNRTFLINLILLVGLNLLVKPVYLLVVEAEIQDRTGADQFGSYFALINFAFILNILLDLGTTNRNTREIARTGELHPHHISSMLVLRLALAAIFMVATLLIGLILGYSNWQMITLAVLAFNQVMASAILYLRSYLTGLHLFRYDSLVSILDRLILLISMSWLLWMSEVPFRIEFLVWGQTAAYGITMLVAFFIVAGRTGKMKMEVDKGYIRKTLRESAPFAWLILISMIACRIDSVMLERITGSSEAGIYAMGFRFFDAMNMISYLFAVLLLPIFSGMLKRGEDVSKLVSLSFRILYSGIFIVSLVCVFFSYEIISMVYENNTTEAARPFGWLMASALFFSLQYVTGTLITASGKMKSMIMIAIVGMFFNILLNSFYIPEGGATGAAMASCFTQVLILVAQWIVIWSEYLRGKLNGLFPRLTVFTILSIGTTVILSGSTISAMPAAYRIVLAIIAATTFALLTRMLDLRRFIDYIRPGGVQPG